MRSKINAMTKKMFCWTIMLATAHMSANAQSRPIRGMELPWPPPSGTTSFIVTPAPGTQPQSLQELVRASVFIFDGTVESIPPVRVLIKGERFETDVIVHVNRVLKGTANPLRIVVTQRGGVLGNYVERSDQFSPMQLGEHYLLFLADDKRANIPAVAGVPRYWIVGEWVGNIRVDNDQKAHLNAASPEGLRALYDNFAAEKLVTELNTALKQ